MEVGKKYNITLSDGTVLKGAKYTGLFDRTTGGNTVRGPSRIPSFKLASGAKKYYFKPEIINITKETVRTATMRKTRKNRDSTSRKVAS